MILNKVDQHIQAIKNVIDMDYNHEQPDIPRTKMFARKYRTFMNNVLKPYGLRVHEFSGNWKDASGFITDGKGNFVYVSVGYGFKRTGWVDDILIRTAEHDKDFRGGNNIYTTMYTFAEDVAKLFGI